MTHPTWTLVQLPQGTGEQHHERRRGICAAKDPSVASLTDDGSWPDGVRGDHCPRPRTGFGDRDAGFASTGSALCTVGEVNSLPNVLHGVVGA
jgi:hypothetical protein